MESKAVVGKVADMLRDHELVIAELYGVLAERQPEDSKLWSVMKTEEEGHARFVERLKSKLLNDEIRFVLGRLHVPTLEKSTKSVRAEIERVKTTDITRVTALGCALAIENGLLDHGFYNIIDEDTPASRQLKSAMYQSIETHVARLYNMYVRASAEAEASRPGDGEPREPVELRPREDIWPDIGPREASAFELGLERNGVTTDVSDLTTDELQKMRQKLRDAEKTCADSIVSLTRQIDALKPVIDKVERALQDGD